MTKCLKCDENEAVEGTEVCSIHCLNYFLVATLNWPKWKKMARLLLLAPEVAPLGREAYDTWYSKLEEFKEHLLTDPNQIVERDLNRTEAIKERYPLLLELLDLQIQVQSVTQDELGVVLLDE